ncbi:MAG: gliding motility-associated ABC transporter permease subunit GldF [Bacteroidota bacterium]
MFVVFRKELNDFLNSLIAYVVIGIFLLGTGLLMWVIPETNVLDYGYSDMQTLFSLGPFVFLFLIPAVTMRSFAEEKRNGTIEVLFTLPFNSFQVVFGKFLACFVLMILAVLPTLVYYQTLYQLGNPVGNLDVAGIIGSYLGMILLGGVFTALGVLSSALTGNQIVSFLLSALLCLSFYAGFDSLASLNPWSASANFIRQAGLLAHYDSLSKGLIDLSDIVYFLSMIALFLHLTVLTLALQKR